MGLNKKLTLSLMLLHLPVIGVAAMRRRATRELEDSNQQLQELSESLSYKSRDRRVNEGEKQEAFFGAMVHQLRTPLTVIQSYAEMLKDNWDHLSEDKKKLFVNKIFTGAIDMDEAIEADLRMIRENLEGWHAECVRTEGLSEYVKEIVQDLNVKFKNIELWDSPIHSAVCIDQKALRRIMDHLIENAYRHGSVGEPVVVTLSEFHRRIEVSVSSTGSSDRELLTEECFERGFRSKHSTGSGMGLWIVRNYARSMAGDISVKQVDRGKERITTFSLDLPKERRRERQHEFSFTRG